MIQIAIHGAGRMAGAIVNAAESRDDLAIVATVGPETPDWQSPAPHFFSLPALPALPALLIDFTLPDGTGAAAQWCAENDVALLSGVTGLPDDITAALQTAADRVLAGLAKQAAVLVDPDTPVAIEDIHHQWKKDAPSGTALMLGEAIRSKRGDGAGSLEYTSIREGEEIGVHTITFKMAGEEIDLVHRARDRRIYAVGALSAGIWLISQPPGLYSAADWLEGRMA
jgi:4-hydroxy-tetrahydrodipicolinate reductase